MLKESLTEASSSKVDSSFRDPSSYLFWEKERIYRQICPSYYDDYTRLMESGLYDKLVSLGLLVPHREVGDWLIEPDIVPFISYPYEWCFSAYKDAAIATLDIMKMAMDYGMVLKDASAYNIQWYKGRPTLIDTASLAIHREGQPWIAYRQFCQHFLAPLALMTHKDVRLGQMMRVYIDGIPLDLASRLLPRFRIGVGLSLHIHGQAMAVNKVTKIPRLRMSKMSLMGIVDNLAGIVRKLKLREPRGGWSQYTANTSYTERAAADKRNTVLSYLRVVHPDVVWDLGANNGYYSEFGAAVGAQVVAFDLDPYCVDYCYNERRDPNILPLVLDATNPSPAIGWMNRERVSIDERRNAELVMALALVHHLAIGNNTSLPMIAEWLRSLGEWLIIEFVPKDDPQVQKLLAYRDDIFQDYTLRGFQEAFAEYYDLIEGRGLSESCRSIYLYRGK